MANLCSKNKILISSLIVKLASLFYFIFILFVIKITSGQHIIQLYIIISLSANKQKTYTWPQDLSGVLLCRVYSTAGVKGLNLSGTLNCRAPLSLPVKWDWQCPWIIFKNNINIMNNYWNKYNILYWPIYYFPTNLYTLNKKHYFNVYMIQILFLPKDTCFKQHLFQKGTYYCIYWNKCILKPAAFTVYEHNI